MAIFIWFFSVVLWPLSSTETFQFTRSDNICDNNAFKGFVGSINWGIDSSFPISMEFHYIALTDVMTNLNSFTWETGLEPLLNATRDRNRHSIIRFYIDYPGKPTAVPQFLIDDGLQFDSYSDYGGGQSPDYSDTNLKSALINFITALGNQYDGDKRIAVIQLGLLGFWGEWHTYPHESWEWDDLYANDIMNAWNNAFSDTQLNVRYPSLDSIKYRLGYHDDSFAYATFDISDTPLKWFFYSQLKNATATEKWTSNIIGGEIYPDLQSTIFESTYTVEQFAQKWELCVNITHSTYMLNSYAFEGTGYNKNNGDYNRALVAMRKLGYFIYLDYVSINILENNNVNMNVNIINDGIAPFYYDLYLIITIKNEYVNYVKTWNDNSLSSDILGANTNYLFRDIQFIFDNQDLFNYFGDDITGQFNATFNISFQLYSSKMYETNPIRFCNVEIDNTNNIGIITLFNSLTLNGEIGDDTTTTNTFKTTLTVSDDNSDNVSIQTLIQTFITVVISLISMFVR